MKLDVNLSLRSLTEAPAIARAAEESGFEGIWVGETCHDPFLQLAVMAEHTTRIQLGAAIALAFTRSPMTLAYTCWDLQELAQGRFMLGLGSQVKGHMERRFSVRWEPPVPRMREVIQPLRAIWRCWHTGEPLNFRGKFYSFSLMTPFFNPGAIAHSEIPILLAAGAGLAAAMGIGVVERKTRIKRYAVMGIVFTAAFALGIAMISSIKSVAVDLLHMLLGNILAVSIQDIAMTFSAALIALFTVLILYRQLMIYSFDPVLAGSLGLRTTVLHYVLMALMTLAIVSALQSVGIVLVVAMLITPASAAYLISNRLSEMMLKAAIIGAASAVSGLYVSYYLNVSSGASMVIVASLLFGVIFVYAQLKKRFRKVPDSTSFSSPNTAYSMTPQNLITSHRDITRTC